MWTEERVAAKFIKISTSKGSQGGEQNIMPRELENILTVTELCEACCLHPCTKSPLCKPKEAHTIQTKSKAEDLRLLFLRSSLTKTFNKTAIHSCHVSETTPWGEESGPFWGPKRFEPIPFFVPVRVLKLRSPNTSLVFSAQLFGAEPKASRQRS